MLYDEPTLYDRLYGDFTEDIPFYRDLLGPEEGRVCELACGNGRVSLRLAEAGYATCGIDLSEAMIATATARAREMSVADHCEFIRADMREFVRPAQFSLTLVPLHSLSHLLTRSDVDRCLSAVRTSLVSDGRLAFAVHNPDPRVLTRDPDALYELSLGGDGVTVYESTSYDDETQILRLVWYVETEDRTHKFEYALRMFFPDEIEATLARSGFELVERYGWYDKTAFGKTSGTQLIVARRVG